MPSPLPSSPRYQYHQKAGTKSFKLSLSDVLAFSLTLVVVCNDDYFLVSSDEEEYGKQPDDDSKEDGNNGYRKKVNTEYEPGIDIPLLIIEGEERNTYYNLDPSRPLVMVEDTQDVYSIPDKRTIWTDLEKDTSFDQIQRRTK